MRQRFFFFFLLLSICSFCVNLTREIQLPFENNELALNENVKSKILKSYLEIGKGNWICFKSISEGEIIKNRILAYKIGKIRNNRIGEFLLKNGILQSQFKRKYSSFESIWLLKPKTHKSSVKLFNTNNTTNKVVKSFKNSRGCLFMFESGNSIEFKPMSFEGFRSDKINVHVQEFNSKYDFVKYGVTALGNKGMLETQGMYFIEAFSNEQKVNLRPRVSYTLKIKDGKSDVPFYSFYGKENGGQLTWVENSQQKFYPESNQKNSGNSFGENNSVFIEVTDGEDGEYNSGFIEVVDTEYVENEFGESSVLLIRENRSLEDDLVGEFSRLGWINCDRFYDAEETITMKFSIDGGDCDTPYSVYIIFKDINSVLPIYKVTNGTYESPKIPVGEEATLLAVQISEKSEKYKFAFQDITISNNSSIDLRSNIINKSDLDSYLRDIIF